MTPEEIAAELTSIYRTPAGTMSLRPLQGLVLLGAASADPPGCWTNAAVGLGKSLMLALLMNVLGGERPLVVTQASSVKQLRNDFERFRLHWRMPSYYRLESYDTISRRPDLLDSLHPTWVGLDEGHKIKRIEDSGRAKRMARWRRAHADVPVSVLTGTPGEDFEAYAHLMVWGVPALGSDRGGPIPVDADGYPDGPEFKALCRALQESEAAHKAFWDRVRNTPGVVISSETYTEKPLRIKHTVLPTPDEMIPHWTRLRGEGEAPDGWVLDSGIGEQYALARMFAQGMYYEHVPRPPIEYTEPRKAWFGMCRDVIEAGEQMVRLGGPYDVPSQVQGAVLAGRLPSGPLEAWLRVKDTYKPITRTAWLSRATLEYMAEWGRARAPLAERTQGGSIIWVDHIGVGDELSRITGWPYFGDGARAGRRHISSICRPCGRGERIDPVIICSTKSCGEGKNLQHRYHRNLMFPVSTSAMAEQRLGRTHRSEQYADVVEAEILYGCLEDWCAQMQSESRSEGAERDLTAPRKLLMAQHERARYAGEDEGGIAWKRVSRVEVKI